MGRCAQIIGQATDWSGVRWDVREARATRHGFDVLIGWRQSAQRGRGGGGVAIIITAELARYLQATRLRDADLPVGDTTIKRLRADVGVRWSWDDWWHHRSDDLAAMTLDAFCVRHGCSVGAASQRRALLKK
jgi:hypothetical protein